MAAAGLAGALHNVARGSFPIFRSCARRRVWPVMSGTIKLTSRFMPMQPLPWAHPRSGVRS